MLIIDAAITGTSGSIKNRHLAVKLLNSAVNEWFMREHAQVIDQETGWYIIRPINEDLIRCSKLLSILESK